MKRTTIKCGLGGFDVGLKIKRSTIRTLVLGQVKACSRADLETMVVSKFYSCLMLRTIHLCSFYLPSVLPTYLTLRSKVI